MMRDEPPDQMRDRFAVGLREDPAGGEILAACQTGEWNEVRRDPSPTTEVHILRKKAPGKIVRTFRATPLCRC